jgi:hypothetical protein
MEQQALIYLGSKLLRLLPRNFTAEKRTPNLLQAKVPSKMDFDEDEDCFENSRRSTGDELDFSDNYSLLLDDESRPQTPISQRKEGEVPPPTSVSVDDGQTSKVCIEQNVQN